MYLEADLVAQIPDNATQPPATPSNGGTSRRLSTIEITMMVGVAISAISLALNIMNAVRKTAT